MQNNEKGTHFKHKSSYMLVTYGILLYMGLQHISSVRSVLSWIFQILCPVSYGICIAFVINLLLNFFRNKVFRAMSLSKNKIEQKIVPILCVFCTTLVGMILLALVLFLIIPQVTTAINTLIEKMPGSQEQLYELIINQLTIWNAPPFIMQKVSEFNDTIDWDTAFTFISNLMEGRMETVLGTAFNATSTIVSTVTNLVLGLIIAIYLLAQKTRVLYILQQMIQLISPKRYQKQIFRVLHLTNQSFANFLTGQFVEAFIIGTLCTIGLTIFRFPYAATIGILTGLTALLPIIGAWIGGGIGALLIWVESPEKTLWFLLFILALQQLEGQFIYPKVVGNSIGLPGLLVLVAVVLGGGFGGVMGIIFAVPVFAILYQLLKDAIERMHENESILTEHMDENSLQQIPTENAVPSAKQEAGTVSPVKAHENVQPRSKTKKKRKH